MKDCRQNYNTNFSFIHGGSTVCFADSDPRPTIKSNFLPSNKNLPPAALRKEKPSLPRSSAERFFMFRNYRLMSPSVHSILRMEVFFFQSEPKEIVFH